VKITVVYVYPNVGNEHYLNLAARFLKSYHEHPAGVTHQSLVVCNGHPPNGEVEFLFGSMENCRVMHHDNSGYDCGAYQHASHDNPDADLMVFFGASSYIKGAGWLARMLESFMQYGSTLYGTMGHRGVVHVGIHPHIRTTSFWIPPALFNQYPTRVSDPSHRYAFEHGSNCLTTWVSKRKLIPYVVSWSGIWRWEEWDSFSNGYHRGDQSDMIAGDRNSEPPFYAVP
jgi:hypothetical protein